MDRFLEQFRLHTHPQLNQPDTAETPADPNMAGIAAMEDLMEVMSPLPPSAPVCLPVVFSSLTVTDPAHASIAEAVAALLAPTIVSAVETAVSQGISQLKKELGVHLQRIQETEHRIFSVEEEVLQVFSTVSSHDDALQVLQDKLEGQENTSRHNKPCLIGIFQPP